MDGSGGVVAGSDSPPRPIPPDTDVARLIEFFEAAGYQRAGAEFFSRYGGFSGIRDGKYVLTEDAGEVRPHIGRAFTAYWSVELGSGIGYGSFYCSFYFDESGKLITHGVWE